MLGDCPDHPRTRGLSRLSLCSGTVVTILVLGDYRDYSCARGLSRPPSCSGTVQTTLVLGECLDYSLTTARGHYRSLLDLCSGTASTTLRSQLREFASRLHATGDSHTVGIFFSSFDLATRLISHLPASSRTTSVRCTCRCISYCLYDNWILNFSGNSF